ncbi:MAG: hypothetical protein Q7T83_11870 [Thermodesulfovibrionales bacterium]|nr:hypothetical protein [Thermodesulfovibrionales bacterium]MDP3111401.1 hypothetical protein [Thermodesulfovibrionales bacterium]
MAFIRTKTFPLLLALLIGGCASTEIIPVIPAAQNSPEEILRAKEIWQKIEERSRTVENNPEWIDNSYTGINIRSLSTLPIGKYTDYKKFLDNGTVYIINHPGYYTFFHHPKISRKDNSPSKSIMDMFLEKDSASWTDVFWENSSEKGSTKRYDKESVRIMKEFERIERNFLEFKSTEQKLVIIIVPGNYKKYSNYTYKNGNDEYASYLNEVTNLSESVLYLESKKPNRGQLLDEDLNTLTEFLQKAGATSIMLGGEYIGRCEEDFYKHLLGAIGATIPVFIVPELSPVSPDDMNRRMKDLLDSDNKLDVQAATYNILNNKYEKLETTPKLRNLKSRLSYERPGENNIPDP